MPKAILISSSNLSLVEKESGWTLEGENLDGYWYVQDVQFPHGYVKEAIITPHTFDSTFKIPDRYVGDPEKTLIPVDYK